jgi:hypothetical protein
MGCCCSGDNNRVVSGRYGGYGDGSNGPSHGPIAVGKCCADLSLEFDRFGESVWQQFGRPLSC